MERVSEMGLFVGLYWVKLCLRLDFRGFFGLVYFLVLFGFL